MNALMLQFFVLTVAGWIHREQQDVIEYLREENRVLREQSGCQRLRLTNDQRRRLAVRAKALGRAALQGLTSIVKPDTLLAWYRKLVAAKYNGASQRGPGRPRTGPEIAKLAVSMAKENPTWGYSRIRELSPTSVIRSDATPSSASWQTRGSSQRQSEASGPNGRHFSGSTLEPFAPRISSPSRS
ncbi:hypothetical protein ACFL5O_06360 [Myxococcota bacterium]